MLVYYFIAMILILGTYFVFFGLRQPEATISEPMSNNKKNFIPSNKFARAKEGYVFKMDEQGLGYYLAKIFASGVAQRKSISLECGLQNGTLAVFVATQLFDEIIYMVPTAAYALIMFTTSLFFVLVVRKIN